MCPTYVSTCVKALEGQALRCNSYGSPHGLIVQTKAYEAKLALEQGAQTDMVINIGVKSENKTVLKDITGAVAEAAKYPSAIVKATLNSSPTQRKRFKLPVGGNSWGHYVKTLLALRSWSYSDDGINGANC